MNNVADMGRYDQVIAFGRVLHECGQVSDLDELFAYLERPWRWQKEFTRWIELGGTLDRQTLNTMGHEWEEGKL